MAAAAQSPSYDTRFDPPTDVPETVAAGIVRVTAGNRGPYTFTGTNSFILGTERLAVIDPGPQDEAHLRGLLAAIAGRPVEAILLTHTHRDHSALAPRLQSATGAPIWFGGRHRLSRRPRLLEWNAVAGASDWRLLPDRVLRQGERLQVAGTVLEVIATPGHCANHLCFGLFDAQLLFSGDHVMGWNSTLVSVPDGSMADYLESLRRLIALPYRRYLPAHGGPIEDGPAFAHALLVHRELRNAQIVSAVRDGAQRTGELLHAIYPHLSLPLLPAARMVLKAHLEYLEAAGILRVKRGLTGAVVRLAQT